MNKSPNIVIVMPAYNAEKTLQRTYDEIPFAYRNHIILVDDASTDATVEVAQNLGINVIQHSKTVDMEVIRKHVTRRHLLMEQISS